MQKTQAIKETVLHTVAVYVAMFAGLLISAVIILIVPGAGQASTVIGRLLDPPFWLSEVACGAVVGWWVRNRFSIRLAGLGIIIPALLLGLDVLLEGLAMQKYTPLIDVYFSSNNGDTEGIYKLIFVAPLYTAVAYTLGALTSKRMKAGAHDVKPEPGGSPA